jgi:acylglycerol lipase
MYPPELYVIHQTIKTGVETMHEETFKSSGGLRIHLRSWEPQLNAKDRPRAVIAICHGVNSHSGQYVWAAEAFTAKGYAVFALDLRGRGKSEGERFYVETVGHYVDDVSGMIKIAKQRYPDTPLYLLGHSAGGVVACTYAVDYQDQIDGLICESFAFQVPAPGFALAAIKGISHIAPRLGVLTLHMRDFTRDPVALKALEADPLTKDEVQPAMTVAALVRADDRLYESFDKIKLPLLIMHGTADKATVCKGSEYFHSHAGASDKTLKLYEGHAHDLLNDIGKEDVVKDIVNWMEERIPVRMAA